MVVAFSPVTASKHIKEKYYRYLKTTFKMGEPYKKEYEALLENQDAFAKGPYLDVTDAFEKGKCSHRALCRWKISLCSFGLCSSTAPVRR